MAAGTASQPKIVLNGEASRQTHRSGIRERLRRGECLVPHTRAQALSLLDHVDFEIGQLTPEQVLAVRGLYYLDDPRSVSERMKGGERI